MMGGPPHLGSPPAVGCRALVRSSRSGALLPVGSRAGLLGHLCWFINGTVCNNDVKKNWAEKISVCRKCPVFKAQLDL